MKIVKKPSIFFHKLFQILTISSFDYSPLTISFENLAGIILTNPRELTRFPLVACDVIKIFLVSITYRRNRQLRQRPINKCHAIYFH